MSNHTKGPWFNEGGTVYDSPDSYETRRPEHVICYTIDDCIIRDYEESKANARLIAAAPDLLEALKAYPGATGNAKQFINFYVKRDAAIAKAEGK